MKIRIENIPDGCEPEIIIRCNQLDESLMRLVYSVNAQAKKIMGYAEGQMRVLDPRDVFYFEVVDNRVFIYCREKVYESKMKLYEIEGEFEQSDFFRSSKSTILNVTKIESLCAELGGRYLALLQNGEKHVVSRQYVPVLKKKLGF